MIRAQVIFSSSVLQQQLRQHCSELEQPQAESSQGNRTSCSDISDATGNGAPVTTRAYIPTNTRPRKRCARCFFWRIFWRIFWREGMAIVSWCRSTGFRDAHFASIRSNLNRSRTSRNQIALVIRAPKIPVQKWGKIAHFFLNRRRTGERTESFSSESLKTLYLSSN